MKQIWTIGMLLVLLCACNHPQVPDNAKAEARLPRIYPDYTDVTIPCNICPLNFAVQEASDDVVARFTYPGGDYTYGDGDRVLIDENEWRDMLEASKGKSIKVEVFAKQADGWHAYKPFPLYVAQDSIDPYISYRVIPPSYVAYEQLSINQRNLTNFDETIIYSNMALSTEAEGQCINCHSYQNYKTDHMLFHMRQRLGGTMLVLNGQLRKVDLKTDSTISAGVYPAWHPTHQLIAFSTNKTGQSFHTKNLDKIEVQDSESDLILYDVERNEVSTIAKMPNELEVFPTWSPDGRTLYFCSAHFVCVNDSIANDAEMITRYTEVKYDLWKADFDPSTKRFSNMEKFLNVSDSLSKSITLPRVSPDGRYMLFSMGAYGCFHVWHNDADIYLMDLKTKQYQPIDSVNSPRSESYPTWSSNGRWIMVDSRRDDGNYTRPYLAYFDKQGKVHKAFIVPQKDPYFYTFYLRSFNRPEFMVEPVTVTPQEFIKKAKEDAEKVRYAQ